MAETPGSPQWWLKRLERDLAVRAKTIARWNAYYEGDHELAFATERFKAAFGGQFRELADNWMALVVDSVEERLNVEGFRFGDDTADADAWYMWQANNLDGESGLGHLEALATGTAYALVDPTGESGTLDAKAVPLVTVEDPTQVIHATDPANRRVRAAALKRWRDDVDRRDLATLYLPDTVFRLERKRGKWDTLEEVPNPLGVVPVVPLENRTRLLGEGVAEHRNVIPLQDAVNKLLADMIIASEFAAFFQRWATGIDIPEDPVTGKAVAPFDVGLDKLLVDSDPDARFGAFPASDLSNYVKAIELGIQHIASQSRTPPHYLLGSMGTWPSGEPVAVTEPVRTANRGWVTMGTIAEGDRVFAPDGSQVAVSGVHDIHEGRPCVEVVFDDATTIVTDEGHRWPVLALPRNSTNDARVAKTVTSSEMAATLRLPNAGNGRGRKGPGGARYAIPLAAPLDGPDVSLPLDPWVLGYWLGNGGRNGSQISVHDQDADWVQARLELAGYTSTARSCSDRRATVITPHGLREPLRQAGVYERKHIPRDYLETSSVKQRLELLQGIMDADGSPDRFGRGTIDLNDSDLAHGIHNLVLSLGQKARIREGRARSRTPDGRWYDYTRWRLAWTPSLAVFSLPRKAELQRITHEGKARVRFVVDVRPVESVPVRCITVDSPEHTFLIGRSLVPTCNSLRATETGLVAKVRRRMRSFEDTWEEVVRLCFKARGDSRADIVDAETVWRDPESRTESEHIDALSKLQALQVPVAQLWEDAGYSPQQIARFRTMSAEDLLQQAITATAQTGPVTADVTPTPQGQAEALAVPVAEQPPAP